MILIIDNYDSFVYNIYQYLSVLGYKATVVRNDALSVHDAKALKPSAIVLSPGPGRPEDAGICMELIATCHQELPIFGVCLGFQAIAAAFGATITRAPKLMHGKVSPIIHNGKGIFTKLANPLIVTRYHSLAIDPKTLPPVFEVTAKTDDQIIMAIRHVDFPLAGVQFHPESYRTEQGIQMLDQFFRQSGGRHEPLD